MPKLGPEFPSLCQHPNISSPSHPFSGNNQRGLFKTKNRYQVPSSLKHSFWLCLWYSPKASMRSILPRSSVKTPRASSWIAPPQFSNLRPCSNSWSLSCSLLPQHLSRGRSLHLEGSLPHPIPLRLANLHSILQP